MKHTNNTPLVALAFLAFTSLSQAAVSVTNTYLTLDGVSKSGYTNPLAVDTGGANPTTVNDGTPGTARFGYQAKVNFDSDSPASWNTTISTGGWSFADIRNDHYFTGNNGNTGWGHASRFFLLEIQQATNFTISLSSAIADARPGFVIFGGESMLHTWGEAHRYSNNGLEMFRNDGWDDNGTLKAPGDPTATATNTRDPGLTYVGNGFNASGNTLSSSIYLDPGLYTLAFGNIGSSTITSGAKTYNLVMSVPEPSAALLGVIGGLAACLRRRRSA
jgi:hypothetical protein